MAISVVRFLIKVAFAVLQAQVVAVVNQQLNIIESQVRAQMQRYVQEVVGGMWRGQGANRFVEEITGTALPSLNRTVEVVRTTNTNISNACDMLQEADQSVRTNVGRIVSVFEVI
jgi:uncharacterized protein YukE